MQENVQQHPLHTSQEQTHALDSGLDQQYGGLAVASPPPFQLSADGDAPIQRRIQPYRDNPGARRVAVRNTVTAINQAVVNARATALNWTQYQGQDGHLGQWYNSAHAYFNNPTNVPGLIYARFGYAVETLACNALQQQMNGLTLHTQVAHGHTRPDIVLKYQDNELAWVDITSENSVGHIKGKDGAGWWNRDYVYEVVYDSLDPAEVLENMNDPLLQEVGSYTAANHKLYTDAYEGQVTRLRDALTGLQQQHNLRTGIGNKQTKQRGTRDFLRDGAIDMDLNNSITKTKGAIALAGINNGPFGFNGTANIAQDGSTAREWAQAGAAQVAAPGQRTNRNQKAVALVQTIGPQRGTYQAAQHWLNAIHAIGMGNAITHPSTWQLTDNLIMRGIAVKHALATYGNLTDTPGVLDDYNNHDHYTTYGTRVGTLRGQLPTTSAFVGLVNWNRNAKRLIAAADLVAAQCEAQDDFEQYLNQKYDDWQNDLLDGEQTLLDNVSAYPNNDAAVTAVQQYMANNPLQQDDDDNDDGPQPIVVDNDDNDDDDDDGHQDVVMANT